MTKAQQARIARLGGEDHPGAVDPFEPDYNLTEHWETSGAADDPKRTILLLSICDEDGEEVAGAIYDPEDEGLDTTSDGCGILVDESHPAYHLLARMEQEGWPTPPEDVLAEIKR